MIHVVGGGLGQLPLILLAKSRGIPVLVTDPHEECPGARFSSFFEQIDVRDVERTSQATRRYRATAIISDQSDLAAMTTSRIAETLGLPGVPSSVASRFCFKDEMRKGLSASFDQFMPRWIAIDESSSFEVRDLDRSGLRLPVVVKPARAQGSRGVTIVRLARELLRALNDARSSIGSDVIMVEEFIEGIEYAVDAVIEDGRMVASLVSEKAHFANNPVLDSEVWFPSSLDPERESDLRSLHERLVTHLGLSEGLTHAEYKISADSRIFLIEIACRGGGSGISNVIFPALTGIDTTGFLLKIATGRVDCQSDRGPTATHALLKFIPNDVSGILREIVVGKDAAELCADIRISATPGQELGFSKDSQSRLGSFVVTGNTRSELESHRKRVLDAISISIADQ